jgi:hypothetical protein
MTVTYGKRAPRAICVRESFRVANLTEDRSLGLRESVWIVCAGVEQIENAILPQRPTLIDAVDTSIGRKIDEAHNRSRPRNSLAKAFRALATSSLVALLSRTRWSSGGLAM